MKLEPASALRAPDTLPTDESRWPLIALLALASGAWVLLSYGESVAAAAATWLRSETYAHGMLIGPISAYLIWRQRKQIAALRPAPNLLGLIALVGAGVLWLAAKLADVDAAQQFMVVAMLLAVAWTLLGTEVFKRLWFPLVFLLLAVPFGDFLIPPLMDFTADFTVAALKLTGIPVFREGNYFTIPSGNWSVVEACSGLRYLIASLTLGCLFAYLTYRTWWRRILFVIASLVVPIFANGLRAYMIVMIGHLSDMKLAVGVDHLIYGWVFFGAVMLITFWVGSFWREDLGKRQGTTVSISEESKPAFPVSKTLPIVSVVTALLVALWPAYADYLNRQAANQPAKALQAPVGAASDGWRVQTEALSDWTPHFLFARQDISRTYAKDKVRVQLDIKFYRDQRQGAELINSQNEIVTTSNASWGRIGQRVRTIDFGGASLAVQELQLRSARQKLLVWHWYWVAGHETVSDPLAKLWQAKAKLTDQGDASAAIFISTPYEENLDGARAALNDFLLTMSAALREQLELASR